LYRHPNVHSFPTRRSSDLLQDIEARYRQRYLDLLTNERSRVVFEKRIAIVRETRRFFEEHGFLEVETPILQTVAGGAAAEPFSTDRKSTRLNSSHEWISYA